MKAADISSYDKFLRIVVEEPGGILATWAWALAILGYLLLIGGWLPLLCSRRRSASASDMQESAGDDPVSLNVVSLLALMLGGGVILMVTLGTLSAYLLRDVLPGMLLSVVLGLVATAGLAMRLRGRSLDWGTSKGIFASVSAFAMLLTLWQHSVSEFACDTEDGPGVAYTDLNGDTSFHVYLAVMVRETGLPLQDLYGSPFRDYCQVTHTGHGVSIAGLSSLFGVSEFRASASLWVAASLLLCWSSMAMLTQSSFSSRLVLAAGVIPLIFGPLMLPSVLPFSQPFAALVIRPGIANRMYWNLPQALSTALAAVSLILFDRYCRAVSADSGSTSNGSENSSRLKLVALVTVTIVASGWVKPSLFIFYAPAIMTTLLVQRARLIEVVTVAVILAMGIVVYLLPVWLVTVPDVPSWSFYPNVEQTIEVGRFVIYGCGAVLLLTVSPLLRLFRELVHPLEPRVLTLPLVAMGGSLLFAVLFREEQFVGFVSFQPNIWWGPSACVLLLIPLLIRHALQQEAHEGRMPVLPIAAALLMLLHVINGFQFALACPAISTRVYPIALVNVMQSAQERTPQGTRFLLDPQLERVDLAAFLRRPALYVTNYMFPEDTQNLNDWKRLFEETEEPTEATGTGWADYEAAIIAEDAAKAQEALRFQGWTKEDLTPGFQLWTRPQNMMNSVDKDEATNE